jgi:hypothetical protein
VSKQYGSETELKHQHRFGTEVAAAAIAAARIKTLIDSINRSVQSLNYDIETEEVGTGATRLIQFLRVA